MMNKLTEYISAVFIKFLDMAFSFVRREEPGSACENLIISEETVGCVELLVKAWEGIQISVHHNLYISMVSGCTKKLFAAENLNGKIIYM